MHMAYVPVKVPHETCVKCVHSVIIPRSGCCVVWDLRWISSSDRRSVGLRKGKGDDGVWGWELRVIVL